MMRRRLHSGAFDKFLNAGNCVQFIENGSERGFQPYTTFEYVQELIKRSNSAAGCIVTHSSGSVGAKCL
jgi:hypothetical protein